MNEKDILKKIYDMDAVDFVTKNTDDPEINALLDTLNGVMLQQYMPDVVYSVEARVKYTSYMTYLVLKEWRSFSHEVQNKYLLKYVYLVMYIFERELDMLKKAYEWEDVDVSNEYESFNSIIFYAINGLLQVFICTNNRVEMISYINDLLDNLSDGILKNLYTLNNVPISSPPTGGYGSYLYECLYSPNYYAVGVYFVTFICSIICEQICYYDLQDGEKMFLSDTTMKNFRRTVEDNLIFANDLLNNMVVVEEGELI